MKGRKRKTRSDKFPLTLHPTGQYCKKIKGRIHYFGSNKKRALERYLDQAAYLHGGQNGTAARAGGTMSVRELRDLYLRYQHSKVLAGELTPQTLQRSDPEPEPTRLLPWRRTQDKEYLHLGLAEL